MTASVSIVVSEKNDVLRIPNSALRFRPPEAESGSAPRTNTQAARPEMTQNGSPGAPGAGGGAGGGGGPRMSGEGGQRKGGGGGNGGFRGPRPGGSGGEGGIAGPGGAPGFAAGGGATRPRPDRGGPRTVYMLTSVAGKPAPELTPVKIRVGVTDGMNTEVVEGLKEGDQVVIGSMAPSPNAASGPGARPGNPFGGGMRRF
jgi:HlyD family secretion protein